MKWTGSFPPGAFPLPSFLLLTLLSVRLLLLVLIIWTLYNPVRDFIPAPRRRNGATSSSSSPSEGERRALLSEGGAVEAGSTASKDGGLGAGGEGGYGTFGESGEEQRIEGRGWVLAFFLPFGCKSHVDRRRRARRALKTNSPRRGSFTSAPQILFQHLPLAQGYHSCSFSPS